MRDRRDNSPLARGHGAPCPELRGVPRGHIIRPINTTACLAICIINLMHLSVTAGLLVFFVASAAHAQDASDCYSPTQNADAAFSGDAGIGCPCDSGTDKAVCVNGVAFFCEGERWSTGYDGPCMHIPVDDREPASLCAMSPGRSGAAGSTVWLIAVAAVAIRRRR